MQIDRTLFERNRNIKSHPAKNDAFRRRKRFCRKLRLWFSIRDWYKYLYVIYMHDFKNFAASESRKKISSIKFRLPSRIFAICVLCILTNFILPYYYITIFSIKKFKAK